jgi:hypothetical protein
MGDERGRNVPLGRGSDRRVAGAWLSNRLWGANGR